MFSCNFEAHYTIALDVRLRTDHMSSGQPEVHTNTHYNCDPSTFHALSRHISMYYSTALEVCQGNLRVLSGYSKEWYIIM